MNAEGILGLLALEGVAELTDVQRQTRVIVAIVMHIGFMLGIFGMAALIALAAPARHVSARARLATAPVRSYLVGLLLLAAFAVIAVALWRHGIRPGRGLVLTLLAAGMATGYATCALALGERAAPDRGRYAQTLIGLAPLVLAMAFPLGWPVALVAAPLGLGAWVLAGGARERS